MLSLDKLAIDCVTSFLSDPDKVALSGTCKKLRAMVDFRIMRKFMPHVMMKRAMLMQSAREIGAARDAGARDLARYAPDDMRLDWCDTAWFYDFSRIGGYAGRATRRDNFIEKLRADPYFIHTYDICEKGTTKMLMTIGSIESVRIAGVVSILVQEFSKNRGMTNIVRVLDLVTYGCVKYDHNDDALAILRARLSTCSFECRKVYRAYRLFASGDIELCKLANITREPDYSARYLKYAARSGSREMCEYVRENYCAQFINVDAMIDGAIKRESIEVCDLAREWIEKYSCIANLHGERDIYLVVGASHYTLARDMLVRAVHCGGSRRMCEYMRKWIDTSHDRFEHELRELDRIDTQALPRIDDSSALFTMVRIEWRRAIDYDMLFKISADFRWYWIADLIYEWKIRDGAHVNLSYLTKQCTPLGKTISVMLRGRFARASA